MLPPWPGLLGLDGMPGIAGLHTRPKSPDLPWVGSEDLLHALVEPGLEDFVLRLEGLVRMTPGMPVAHTGDSGLDHFFEAPEAGLDGGVDPSPGDGDPKAGGRQQDILLRVNAD